MEVCLAGRVQSALTSRQRGKVPAANAGRHSLRWCVQLGERGDEGRINWHSGGGREGGRQPLSPSVLHSFSSWWIDEVYSGFLDTGGKASACPGVKWNQNESTFHFVTVAAPNQSSSSFMGAWIRVVMHLKMILQPIAKLLMSARDTEDGETAPMPGFNYWLCVTNCLDKSILLMKEAN